MDDIAEFDVTDGEIASSRPIGHVELNGLLREIYRQITGPGPGDAGRAADLLVELARVIRIRGVDIPRGPRSAQPRRRLPPVADPREIAAANISSCLTRMSAPGFDEFKHAH